MVSIIIFAVSVLVLVGIDQLIKYIVETNMTVGQTIPCIKWLVQWTYTQNKGASFSILQGKTVFLVLVTAAMMAAMIWFLAKGKVHHWVGTVSFALILAGGVGNLIDRLFKGGLVTDFIDIRPLFDFPIFNFADCCITVGEVLLCVYILFLHEKYSKKQENRLPTTESETIAEAENEA